MWFVLDAARLDGREGHADAVRRRERAARNMTPARIAAAERMAAAWRGERDEDSPADEANACSATPPG